jgi:hypothetical protein
MRTDDLIHRLVLESTLEPGGGADARDPEALRRGVLWSAALGLLISAPVAAAWFGLRPGLLAEAAEPGVALKLGLAAAFTLGGLWLARRAGEPGRASPFGAALAPVVALGLGAFALWPGAAAEWIPTYDAPSVACMIAVALLALAPLALILAALRRGAVTRPTLAGAAAGLASGGVGSAAYALYCPVDLPGYVMTWYPAGVLAAVGVGALLGRRVLIW